eukprot:UN08233
MKPTRKVVKKSQFLSKTPSGPLRKIQVHSPPPVLKQNVNKNKPWLMNRNFSNGSNNNKINKKHIPIKPGPPNNHTANNKAP